MANSLRLLRVWRLVKEVDLDAIRREAGRRVRVLVVGEDTADADALAIRLAEGGGDPVGWLTAVDAPLGAAPPAAAGLGARPGAADDPDVVIAIVRGTVQTDAMKAARQLWASRGVRLLTVAVGSRETPGTLVVQGDLARVAIDRLGDEGLGRVADGVFSIVEPERRIALARQSPAMRPGVFHAVIEDTARANAGYAFSTGLAEIVPILDIPLNIGDMIVLSKNQLMMSYRIALAAGRTGEPRELVAEIVGVLGGGLLFRQVARQLVGLLPVIGLVPKVAVAYGGTWAIGKAVVVWATGGGRLTAARLRQLSREGLERGRKVAQALKRGTEL
jgi:uncharacterized protein (DUF697 family)